MCERLPFATSEISEQSARFFPTCLPTVVRFGHSLIMARIPAQQIPDVG